MTGTPYESWFTDDEKARYREVLERRTPESPLPTFRPPMSRLKWLVWTDMSHEEMARELGVCVDSVVKALTRMGLRDFKRPPVGGPTYMAHDWYMNRKDRRIWV